MTDSSSLVATVCACVCMCARMMFTVAFLPPHHPLPSIMENIVKKRGRHGNGGSSTCARFKSCASLLFNGLKGRKKNF